MEQLRSDTLDRILEQYPNMVLIVASPLCKVCARVLPQIEEIMGRNPEKISLYYYMNDQFSRTNAIIGRVSYFPTIIVFKDNKMEYKVVTSNIEEIENLISK